MLTRLNIKNFLFIDQVSLTFLKGMTVFTGETGAGKSILYDALWLTLGATVDKDVLTNDKPEGYVEAYFDIQNLMHVKHWIEERGYNEFLEQENGLCLKRIIFKAGRSKALINGKIARTSDLKLLGERLVNLYGQHHHQRLLKREHQRDYLDHYGEHHHLIQKVENCYKRYLSLEKKQKQLTEQIQAQQAQADLWHYHLEELKDNNVAPEEWTLLNQEYHRLTHVEQILQNGHETLWLVNEAEPLCLMTVLQNLKKNLQKIIQLDDRFQTADESLEQAALQLHEFEALLRHTLQQVNSDPARLSVVEQRINLLNNLARKHHVKVEELPDLIERLHQQHFELDKIKQDFKVCQDALSHCFEEYKLLTDQLRHKRKESALALQTSITEKIQGLGMPGGYVEIRLLSTDSIQLSKKGTEGVEFYLSSIPGQPAQPLSKIASGGELSRINLVVQTLLSTSKAITIPTLIFDEIDVGIGGGIAEQVGRLLYDLGKHHQVICITHLPQIAALTPQHYQITKRIQVGKTQTVARYLGTKEARIQEISRMLGGVHISNHTIAHAESLLKDQ